jgi:chemotaxis methyl-accepting protein methylase
MTGDKALEEAVDRVSALLGQQIGLRPQSALRGRLRRCVRDQAAAYGATVGAYADLLTRRGDVLQSLMNEITVQESGFFRHPQHFEVLGRDILPRLTPPVTIWSAGCANGQEAYSLAMLMEERGIAGTVLATDLSTAALARTSIGSYTTRELSGVSAQRFQRHLTPTPQGGQVNAGLRARVITARHNLVEALPERAKSSQVVFCRNVLIYFAPDQTRDFLSRLADSVPASAVFLGSAESMWSVSDRFQTVDAGDCYYYRPRGAGANGRSSRPGAVITTHSGRTAPASRVTTASRRQQEKADPVRNAAPAATRPPPRAPSAPAGADATAGEASAVAAAGQLALDAGEHRSAVVAFRKWAYLSPDDALAHLSLGLAFEACGDLGAARRAYAMARRVVAADAAPGHYAIGGFAATELVRLLDTKHAEMGL